MNKPDHAPAELAPSSVAVGEGASSRLTSLDAVKGLGIIAVVCLHAVRPDDPPPSLVWEIVNQVCRFAVPAFFIVAGFFFMRAWQRAPGAGALLQRYALRLLMLLFFWGLFFAVIPPFVGGAPQGNGAALRQHLGNILRHPHPFLLTGYVYHLWFLSSLLQGLVLVWLCLRFWSVRGALWIGTVLYGAALLGAAYAGTRIGFQTHFDMKNGPFTSTLSIALGVWLAQRRNFSVLPGVVLLSLGLALQLAEAFWLRSAFGRALMDNAFLIGTIPYAVGVVWLALARPTCGRLLASLGTASLGLYVLHVYVIECLRHLPLVGATLQSPWLFAGAVLVITWMVVLALGKVHGLRGLLR